MLIVIGLVLGLADRFGANDKVITRPRRCATPSVMGLAQALRADPGRLPLGRDASRRACSSATSREAATRYAFLLAIPAVVGAGLFELKDIPNGDNALRLGSDDRGHGRRPSSSGTPRSPGCCATSSTHSYLPFVIYRVALGSFVLVLLGVGVLTA